MPVESLKSKRTRALAVLEQLQQLYPAARSELDYSTPFELLISTILSAQATDKSVNACTPALFAAYPDAASLARADIVTVEEKIRTIGLYRSKAKNIVKTAQMLEQDHQGTVPNDFSALLKMAGVGRKTANVVLSNAFGRPAIAVDTHVKRLANLLKFSKESNPDKIEKDLEKIFPKEQWIFTHHALILHGRRVCIARRPQCDNCNLTAFCPSSQA